MKSIFADWRSWALLSAMFAALTAIFGKVGVESLNSDFATLIRTGFVIAILAVIVMSTHSYQPLRDISLRTYLFLALSALATGLSWLCYYRALKLGPASGVAPIDKLSVVFVAILAFVLLGERPPAQSWLGIVLITVGAILMAF